MSFDNIVPLLWAMGSINSFVTMQVFVKLLSAQISAQYIIYMRSVLLFILNSIFILKSSDYQPYSSSLEPSNFLNQPTQKKFFTFNIKNSKFFTLMLKRQFWTAVSINLLLSSLKFVKISIANALYNLTPIFTFFIEAVYYNKVINKLKLVLTFLSFLGVFIILNPHLSFQRDGFDWHVLMPLAACLAACMNFLYLHEMRGNFKEIQVLQYTYTFQLVTSGLIVVAMGEIEQTSPSQSTQHLSLLKIIIYTTCVAMFAYISNFLRIKTLFKRKPSQVLAFNYTGIIYSIFLDVIFFKNSLHFLQIFGVLLTSAGLLSQLLMDFFKKQ